MSDIKNKKAPEMASEPLKEDQKESLGDVLKTVLYAVIIAVGFRTFAYEPFSIPSGSMIPTLLVGDYLFVSKFSYGYSRYSLPFSLPLIPGRIFFTPPERGDVAVFKLPSDNSTDYIKRIIGLPGDQIQVISGILHINGVAAPRTLLGEYTTRRRLGDYRAVPLYNETLPPGGGSPSGANAADGGGVTHEIIEYGDGEPLDNTGIYTVPEGHYFAMGDNRDNSLDSRVFHGVGFIPQENLIGRAEVKFFSHDGTSRWWEVWNWPSAVRFSRIFGKIT